MNLLKFSEGLNPSNHLGGGPDGARRPVAGGRDNNATSQQQAKQALVVKASYTQLLGIKAQDCPAMPVLRTRALVSDGGRDDKMIDGIKLLEQASIHKMLQGRVGLHFKPTTTTDNRAAASNNDVLLPVTGTEQAVATLAVSPSAMVVDDRKHGGYKVVEGSWSHYTSLLSSGDSLMGGDDESGVMIALGSHGSIFSL
jgi:hypothetical protein